MNRTSDPTQIDHPALREFAIQAVWVAKLEEAAGIFEDLMVDVGEDDRPAARPMEDEDPLQVAWSVVNTTFEAADQALEARVTEWLAQDPEHWPIFRLVVLDPWSEQLGTWREDAPGWVRSLGTNTALVHFQQDPSGRQRSIDFE